MMDPSGIVRTIPTPAPLPLDSPSMCRIHPFERLFCDGDPSVDLAMKFAKTYPLIAVLGSKVTLRCLISVIHFVILPLASGFSIMVLCGYSVSTTMGKD